MNKNLILSWDETFMQMCDLIARRSKDPNTKCGAVIVDQENVIVGLGYNGWPRGIDQDALPWDREGKLHETKYAYVVHAEANAIYNSNKDTRGCKLYVNLFPCNECAKILIQNGIKEVIYKEDKYHDTEICQASRKMFDLAGVKYRQYILEYELDLIHPVK